MVRSQQALCHNAQHQSHVPWARATTHVCRWLSRSNMEYVVSITSNAPRPLATLCSSSSSTCAQS